MRLIRLGAALLTMIAVVAVCGRRVLSFRLSPTGTVIERNIAKKTSRGLLDTLAARFAGTGVEHFSGPVHEEISNRIYDCEGGEDLCGDVDADYATPYVMAGVRWNDDPPFQLQDGQAVNTACKTSETIRFTTQPQCWYQLFRDAESRASRGQLLDSSTQAPLLSRSHFGDLQFLHAMASVDGEPATETKRRIMMWAEFTWKVNRGDYGLDTMLKDVDVAGFDRFFGHSAWRVQDLFALGNPVLRRRIREVAFGSLLHIVEDSFAKGHVDRDGFGSVCAAAPGRTAAGAVKEFHSYVRQDPSKHARYDSRNGFVVHWEAARPNVVDVGHTLREYQERDPKPAAWDEVQPYVDCIFPLQAAVHTSSAGSDFTRGH